MRDHRTHCAYSVRHRASAKSMEQYRAHYLLYADKSTMYVKDSLISRVPSPRASPAAVVLATDSDLETDETYAVSDDQGAPAGVVPEAHDGRMHRGA